MMSVAVPPASSRQQPAIVTAVAGAAAAADEMVVPLARIISPAEFEREREQIFVKSWLPAGHVRDVPAPGDFIVREFHVPRASALIVHGRDGVIRAFHNICRHRGNRLAPAGAQGTGRGFACSFHGWSWDTTGALRGVTDAGQFPCLDKDSLGLLPIHCETWNGLVFLNFDKRPREPLYAWMDELADGYEDYFELQHKLSSHSFEIEANWNLGVNAFTEGYHTLYIHRNTAGDYQGGAANPQRHRPFMQFMKRHTRYSAPANPGHVLAPAEELAWRYGRRLLPAACFQNETLPPAVNPSRAEHWLFDVIEVFPNMVMLLGQNYRIELTFQPVTASRTIVTNETFVYEPRNLAERASQELFRQREREVVREDLSLLEAQQEALSTGAMENVVLSRQEMALAHHFRVRKAMLEAGT
ncbi:MAG TPA: aromatic ring-hydroxylating dioxygenase subunit alpha [Ramlibacter sp.]|nr:aromatic ring-hydroxylating dioxygenase subunit alpha [Ramlibacter sp.]